MIFLSKYMMFTVCTHTMSHTITHRKTERQKHTHIGKHAHAQMKRLGGFYPHLHIVVLEIYDKYLNEYSLLF